MARTKQLSVRFEPELLERLEIIANKEHRPIANQVVHFVAESIEEYLDRKNLYFAKEDDGVILLPRDDPSSSEPFVF